MKKIICFLLCASLLLLNGCGGNKAANAKASLVQDGKLMYRVIRPKNIEKNLLEVYTEFYTELKESVKIDSETDSGEIISREVLLGNTKREESKEALKKLDEKKKSNSDYIIAVINGKIVVTSNDGDGLTLAFERFLNDYVKKNKIPEENFEKIYFAADEKEPDAAIVGEQQNLDGYKLVWSEEFDGPEIDKKKIKITKQVVQPENSKTVIPEINLNDYVYIKDGQLYMVSKRFGDSFVSGGISTSSSMRFCYGYLEARVRLTQGTGYWPAFWVNAANLGYEMAPEIDIYEIFGTVNELVSNLHFWSGTDSSEHYSFDGGTSGPYIKKENRMVKISNVDQFHTIGLEWTRDYIATSVDGRVFWKCVFDDYNNNFKEWMAQELYVLFSLGVVLPDSDETNMIPVNETTQYDEHIVDYIRLYQKDGVKGASLTINQ